MLDGFVELAINEQRSSILASGRLRGILSGRNRSSRCKRGRILLQMVQSHLNPEKRDAVTTFVEASFFITASGKFQQRWGIDAWQGGLMQRFVLWTLILVVMLEIPLVAAQAAAPEDSWTTDYSAALTLAARNDPSGCLGLQRLASVFSAPLAPWAHAREFQY